MLNSPSAAQNPDHYMEYKSWVAQLCSKVWLGTWLSTPSFPYSCEVTISLHFFLRGSLPSPILQLYWTNNEPFEYFMIPKKLVSYINYLSKNLYFFLSFLNSQFILCRKKRFFKRLWIVSGRDIQPNISVSPSPLLCFAVFFKGVKVTADKPLPHSEWYDWKCKLVKWPILLATIGFIMWMILF